MEFWSINVSPRRMNGLWIDMITVLLTLLHINYCYFWMLFVPLKIMPSDKTKADLNQYTKLKNKLLDQ